jgi:prepilin-type N-terminal cleavage/methylation domain-containing protein
MNSMFRAGIRPVVQISPVRRIRLIRRNGAPAFTMIELLLVIAIIGIIVSFIAVASFAAAKSAQIKGTRGIMQQIANALAAYKLDHGMFVPAQPSWIADNPVLDSTYPLWQALELDGKYFAAPAANKLAGDKDPYDSSITRYKYVDAWEKPLWYQCPPLKYNKATGQWDPDGGDFSRFRLVSSGPDKVLGAADTDAATGDNIIVE